MAAYPVKISQQQDGTYTWSCPIEAEYHRDSMRPGLYACIAIAVFLLAFGGMLAYSFHDPEYFLIVAGCAAIFLVISILFFGLAFSAEDPHESYQMTDEYVESGYGKASVIFAFRKADTIVLGKRYIELCGKSKRMRVYVPEEDFDFVRGYMQSRVPIECEIRYE